MNREDIKWIENIVKREGYKEVILNFDRKEPLVIEGIKGCFVPEVLCYTERKLKALITFVKSLDETRELHKLSLFMDYSRKNNLYLYIVYSKQQFLEAEIVQKLKEIGAELSKNINFIAI